MQDQKPTLGLSTKIIAATMGIVAGVVAVNSTVFNAGSQENARRALLEKAAAFTAIADEARLHAERLITDGTVDPESLEAEAREHVAAGGSYGETRAYRATPIVAGWSAAHGAAEREGIDFRLTAFNAESPAREPEPRGFRAMMLRDLIDRVASGNGSELSRVNRQTGTLHYMRAAPLGRPMGGGSAQTDTETAIVAAERIGAYEVVLPLAPIGAQAGGLVLDGLKFTLPMMLLACGILALMLHRLIARPLNELTLLMRSAATGGPVNAARIDTERADAIGRLARWSVACTANTRARLAEIAGENERIASASREIITSCETLTTSLGDQRARTRSAEDEASQLSRRAEEITRRGVETARRVESGLETATQGGEALSAVVNELRRITSEVGGSVRSVSHLGEKSDEISGIVGLINDIAEQTNLLALNASIEAARAGDQGRGFAVVADEIRRLAERTTRATEQIGMTVREIRDEACRAAESIEAGSVRVETSARLAAGAGESLRAITESTGTLLEQIRAMTDEAEAQSSAASRVGQTVCDVSAESTRSVVSAGRASRAAADLAASVERIRQLAERARKGVDHSLDRSAQSKPA